MMGKFVHFLNSGIARKLFKLFFHGISEDGHSNQEIPVPIPNTEVKLITSVVLVSHKRQSFDAVFLFFLNIFL